MAIPTWVDIPDADFDLDSPVETTVLDNYRKTGSADRLFEGLRSWVEGDSTGTLIIETFYIPWPDLEDDPGMQRRLAFELEAYSGDGSAVAVRVMFNGGVPTGPEVLFSNITNLVYQTFSSELLDTFGDFRGSLMRVDIQVEGAGGQRRAFCRAVNALWRQEF